MEELIQVPENKPTLYKMIDSVGNLIARLENNPETDRATTETLMVVQEKAKHAEQRVKRNVSLTTSGGYLISAMVFTGAMLTVDDPISGSLAVAILASSYLATSIVGKLVGSTLGLDAKNNILYEASDKYKE